MLSYSQLVPIQVETNPRDLMPRFIGLRLSEESRAYLEPRIAAIYKALVGIGWPIRLVPSEKWHMTVLWFERLSQEERAVLWRLVEVFVKRGTWDHLDFVWQGLALWHNPKTPSLVPLAAEKFRAVAEWGLKSWLTDPICRKGRLDHLKSYRPHITLFRFLDGRMDQRMHREWGKELESTLTQFEPIDPMRIQFDRISLFLSDFSQHPHAYIFEETANIGQELTGRVRVPRRGQLEFTFEE